MNVTNPKILAMYRRKAAARGMTLETWLVTVEREHAEEQERTSCAGRVRVIARAASRRGNTFTVYSVPLR